MEDLFVDGSTFHHTSSYISHVIRIYLLSRCVQLQQYCTINIQDRDEMSWWSQGNVQQLRQRTLRAVPAQRWDVRRTLVLHRISAMGMLRHGLLMVFKYILFIRHPCNYTLKRSSCIKLQHVVLDWLTTENPWLKYTASNSPASWLDGQVASPLTLRSWNNYPLVN